MKLAIGNQEAIQLRRRITKLGITQKELATQINVSERYIRDISNYPKVIVYFLPNSASIANTCSLMSL